MAFYSDSTDQTSDIFYSDSSDEDYSDMEDFIESNPLLSSIMNVRNINIEPSNQRSIETQTIDTSSYSALMGLVRDLSQQIEFANNEIAHLVDTKQSLQTQIGFLHRHLSPPLNKGHDTWSHLNKATTPGSFSAPSTRDFCGQTDSPEEPPAECNPISKTTVFLTHTPAEETTQPVLSMDSPVEPVSPAATISPAAAFFSFTSDILDILYTFME